MTGESRSLLRELRKLITFQKHRGQIAGSQCQPHRPARQRNTAVCEQVQIVARPVETRGPAHPPQSATGGTPSLRECGPALRHHRVDLGPVLSSLAVEPDPRQPGAEHLERYVVLISPQSAGHVRDLCVEALSAT